MSGSRKGVQGRVLFAVEGVGGWGLAFVDLWMKPLGTQSSGDSRRLGGLGLGANSELHIQLQVEASGP